MVLEALSEAFFFFRNICGTVCVISIISFIVFWLSTGKKNFKILNPKREKTENQKTQSKKSAKKIIDIEPEDEEEQFKKYDQQTDDRP